MSALHTGTTRTRDARAPPGLSKGYERSIAARDMWTIPLSGCESDPVSPQEVNR
jgi:hypothetical protein